MSLAGRNLRSLYFIALRWRLECERCTPAIRRPSPNSRRQFFSIFAFHRISAASDLISVKSRCISLQPYHVA